MKRDLTLLREILLAAEGREKVAMVSQRLGVPTETLREHAFNAAQAGLVEATDPWQPTWKGQEVLELVRDEERFTAARERVRERTGGENLDLILRELEYPVAQILSGVITLETLEPDEIAIGHSLANALLTALEDPRVGERLGQLVRQPLRSGPSETTAAAEPSIPAAVSDEVIP